jgi:hypothetical protein
VKGESHLSPVGVSGFESHPSHLDAKLEAFLYIVFLQSKDYNKVTFYLHIMANMKNLYKIYAVLSAIIGVFFAYIRAFLILIGVFIILVICFVPLYPTVHFGTLTLLQSFILCGQNNYHNIHWCIPPHDTYHPTTPLDYALDFSVLFGLPLAIGLIIYGIFHKKKIKTNKL